MDIGSSGEKPFSSADDLLPSTETGEKGEADKDLESGTSRGLSMSEGERQSLVDTISAKKQKAEIMAQTLEKMGDNAPFESKTRVFELQLEVAKLQEKLAADELLSVEEKVPERFDAGADLSGVTLEDNDGRILPGKTWKVKSFLPDRNVYSVVDGSGELKNIDRVLVDSLMPTEKLPVKSGDKIGTYGSVESVGEDGQVMFDSGQTVELSVVQGELKKSLEEAKNLLLVANKRKNNVSKLIQNRAKEAQDAANSARDRAFKLAA